MTRDAPPAPLTVYRLLRLLLVHVLHGRGRDTVSVSVWWTDADGYTEALSADADTFTWEGDGDRFCTISGTGDAPLEVPDLGTVLRWRPGDTGPAGGQP